MTSKIIWLALALSLALAGCSATSDPPKRSKDGSGPVVLSQRPPISTTPSKRDDTVGLSLPIDAFKLAGERRQSVNRAERILVAKCMAQFGFADPHAGTPQAPLDPDPLARRYGITDLNTAQRWGYHLPETDVPEPVGQARQPSPAELLVLTGSADGPLNAPKTEQTRDGKVIPVGGCLGEARRKLSPEIDLGTDPELVRRIDGSPQSDTDPQVVKVFADWASCMKSKGFDRTKPVKDPKSRQLQAQPTPAEIQEATSDVQCKRQTNLVGVWFAAESVYQEAMIQQNIVALNDIKRKQDATVRLAAEVVAAA